MANCSNQYQDVIDLADFDGTQEDSLFFTDSVTQPPESYSASPTQLSPAQPYPTNPGPRKRWSALRRWKSSAEVASHLQRKVEWAETQVRERVANTIAQTTDLYTAAQTTAMKSIDNWFTSLDESLFLPKDSDAVGRAPCPIHRDGRRCGDNDSCSKQLACVSKVNLYNNSRLPADLPPLQLDPSAHSMVSLAAQYSHRVYQRSVRSDAQSYVAANLRHGTKAMVLDSSAVDSMATIVLAIRGTQSFKDWLDNMKTQPKRPVGFLDDASNACHAGFLRATKRMVGPVTERLRRLLEDNPHYESYSLLITGHSAGGAVGGLLYCHLLATTVSSELTTLSRQFQRVHCVTFGAPPCALRPVFPTPSPESEHSLFYAFINEGDPVPRADKTYVRSLLSLYATPAPSSMVARTYDAITRKFEGQSTEWKIPRAHLSLAGQLVVLRPRDSRSRDDVSTFKIDMPGSEQEDIDIAACLTTDEAMRQTVFGNPGMHIMGVYARRIEQMEVVEPRKAELRRRVRRSDMVPVREVGREPHSVGGGNSSGDSYYPPR